MPKLVASLEPPTISDESLKVTSVPFFIPDFNSLSCKLDNLHLKCYNESFYIKAKNKITILLQFLVKKLKQFLLLLQ